MFQLRFASVGASFDFWNYFSMYWGNPYLFRTDCFDDHSTTHVITSLPSYRADGGRKMIATQMILSIYWISPPLLDLEEISFYPTQLPSISPKYPVVKMERERRQKLIRYNYIWQFEKTQKKNFFDVRYTLLESIKWTPFFSIFSFPSCLFWSFCGVMYSKDK